MPGAFGPGDALVDCVRVHMSVRKSALRLGASLPLARVVLSVPIASASAQGSPTQDRQPPAVVRGAVYDSLRQEPFRFAQVVLAGIGASQGRNLGMRADTNGRFELIGVPRGAYRVGFYHPALDSLGIEVAPVDVRVESDTTVIQLGSPSALAVPRDHLSWCRRAVGRHGVGRSPRRCFRSRNRGRRDYRDMDRRSESVAETDAGRSCHNRGEARTEEDLLCAGYPPTWN